MTSLPILKVTSAPTPETLVRYFHQAESNWTEHFAERNLLDFGTAWTNPQLERVHIANRMLDVALPSQISPQQAFDLATEYFRNLGCICWKWTMNPTLPREQTVPMQEFLLAKNYHRQTTDIMYLDRVSLPTPSAMLKNLKIIPARSSFRHARELLEEKTRKWNTPQLVEAGMLHLDDPHYDSLIAIKDGKAAANVGVLSIGETGVIEELFVSESFRCVGIATIMMDRALEICARSLFKHVLSPVAPDNEIAIHLYKKFGFRKIGEYIEYQNPG